jgi:hypothetical protein
LVRVQRKGRSNKANTYELYNLKTLNDYHSSLIQKKKKHPIKERKQIHVSFTWP